MGFGASQYQTAYETLFGSNPALSQGYYLFGHLVRTHSGAVTFIAQAAARTTRDCERSILYALFSCSANFFYQSTTGKQQLTTGPLYFLVYRFAQKRCKLAEL